MSRGAICSRNGRRSADDRARMQVAPALMRLGSGRTGMFNVLEEKRKSTMKIQIGKNEKAVLKMAATDKSRFGFTTVLIRNPIS